MLAVVVEVVEREKEGFGKKWVRKGVFFRCIFACGLRLHR